MREARYRMGSNGEKKRNRIRKIIDSVNKKSTATFTTVTVTDGSQGGYGAKSTSTTSETINCIPSRYISNRLSFHKFGDLPEGGLRLLVRDDQTLDTNDLIVFDGDTYSIKEIEPIVFNEIVVAQTLTLTKELNES